MALRLSVLILLVSAVTWQKVDAAPSHSVRIKEPFTVRCYPEKNRQDTFAQFSITLTGEGELFPETIETHLPVIRHEIILLTGDRTATDLRDRKLKDNLADVIQHELNLRLKSIAPGILIKKVSFSSFVLQ